MAKPLSAEEEDLAALLARCGLRRGASRCLAALLRETRQTIQDLSTATGLPPQAVSEAVRDLDRLGLVVRESLPQEGRGRPTLGHRLPASAKETLRKLEEDRRRVLSEELARLDELRRRAS